MWTPIQSFLKSSSTVTAANLDYFANDFPFLDYLSRRKLRLRLNLLCSCRWALNLRRAALTDSSPLVPQGTGVDERETGPTS